MYTTRQSLIDTWGLDTVKVLLGGADSQEDLNRLAKAANIASALINGKLSAAGYALPLLFTGYDDVIVPPVLPSDPIQPPHLNAILQNVSDCLTAYYLGQGYDLAKKEFDDCRREGETWLNALKNGLEELPYPLTATATGRGDAVVLARKSILDAGYPGCCGRRWFNAVS
jgi:hypothetical protein